MMTSSSFENQQAESAKAKPMVFVSYHSSDMKLVQQLVEKLIFEGFNIYVDFRNMVAETIDQWIESRDSCAMLIVCFSFSYYRSCNCRGEAFYANSQEKPILFLNVEPGYQPDGWLAALTGSQYLEMNENNFESLYGTIRNLVNTCTALTQAEKASEAESAKLVSDNNLMPQFVEILKSGSANKDHISEMYGLHYKVQNVLLALSKLAAASDVNAKVIDDRCTNSRGLIENFERGLGKIRKRGCSK